MSKLKQELIPALPRNEIEHLLTPGFTVGSELSEVIPENVWYVPRHKLENNKEMLHFIPYIVCKNMSGTEILSYKRPDQGEGEDRLKGKRSIGLGGHPDVGDAVIKAGKTNSKILLENAAVRELSEELGIEVNPLNLKFRGTIYDPSDDVGLHHIGVVFSYVLDDETFNPQKTEIEDLQWNVLSSILDMGYSFEGWSHILLQHITKPEGSVSNEQPNFMPVVWHSTKLVRACKITDLIKNKDGTASFTPMPGTGIRATLPSSFVSLFNPINGGYLVCNYGEDLKTSQFMSALAFEKEFVPVPESNL